MNAYTFFDAVGMIDDDMIASAGNRSRTRRHKFPTIAAAAASAAIIAGTLPAATAFGSSAAYHLLHSISPYAAQTFVPVHEIDIYDGIRMEVLSASVEGSEAVFDVSLCDTEGSRITADTDLFDSYYVYTNSYSDGSAHCETLSFDEAAGTITYRIHITRNGGVFSPDEKITFGFTQFLPDRQKYEGVIEGIDISRSIPLDVSTRSLTDDLCLNGGGGEGFRRIDPLSLEYLVPAGAPLAEPADKCYITGIGYIGGYLHIQQFCEDTLSRDTHGFVWLEGTGTEHIDADFTVSYSDSGKNGQYYESFFEVNPSELENCGLYGYFVTGSPALHGKWQVSFILDDKIVTEEKSVLDK